MSEAPLEVCLYSSADLNIVSGSSIWVQAVAETLVAGPRVHLTVPLRTPERRDLITGPLRRLDRVELVPPQRQRRYVPPSGLHTEEAVDLIERLDREHHFEAILLRSFPTCRAAAARPALRGRLWSCYILEPERDADDPAYVAQLTAIAKASAYVVVQSEEMRALFEALVPAGRGKTIVLPPAIPASTAAEGKTAPYRRRLLYAGKFHPFYPVELMIEWLSALRASDPDLEFHVLGDQFFWAPADEGYGMRLEHLLTTTPGVVWHGALSRAATGALLAEGGVALSLWDYRHGSTMNDLVVSTKLLDYSAAGLPVVLNRTAAQEAILGPDYPLFVDRLEDAREVIAGALGDEGLYRAAALRARSAVLDFEYPAVYRRLRPYLEGLADAGLRQLARPKLDAAAFNLGLLLPADATEIPPEPLRLLAELRAVDARFRLIVGRLPTAHGTSQPGADGAAALRRGLPPAVAAAMSVCTVDDPANWWRTVGFAVILPADRAQGLHEACASGAVPVAIGGAPMPSALRPFRHPHEAAAAAAVLRMAQEAEWTAASAAARAWALPGSEA